MGNPKIVRRLVNVAKSSPWLMIAIGLHVILAAVLSLRYIRGESEKPTPAPTQIAVTTRHLESVEVLQPPEDFIRTKIPELETPVELVTEEEVAVFLPTDEQLPEDLYLDIGDPTGSENGSDIPSSTSIGVGKGGQRGQGPTSRSIFDSRPGSSREPRLGRVPTGKTAGTEKAVLAGLRWLLRHQDEDGSWSPGRLHTHCTKTPCIAPDPALGNEYDVGMTALALLAFLGQGISIDSKVTITDTALGQKHRADLAVKRGVRWLLDRQQEDGSFSASATFEHPENETLATMVLCEAYGLSRNRELRRPAQNALDFLVGMQLRDAEGRRSGWGAGPVGRAEGVPASGETEDGNAHVPSARPELPITCWVTMALRSAQSCGLAVSADVLEGALRFSLASAGLSAGPEAAASERSERAFVRHATRPALSILIRAFAGGALSDPYLEQAASELASDLPEIGADGLSVDFYYWYFASLALNQLDGPDSPRPDRGEYWEPWNEALIESLLPLQNDSRMRDDCARGGWLVDARGNQGGRALYNTALNVLTLEVYYRYENVFGALPPRPATGTSPARPR